MEKLSKELRQSVRSLLRHPSFTAVAVITLMLAIGVNTTIFSVVNAVLLRPLPYAHPESLVRVHEVVPQYGRFAVAPATFLDWRQQNASFARMAAYTSASATFMLADGPERISGVAATWDLFDTLGAVPQMGSGFTAAQDAPGSASPNGRAASQPPPGKRRRRGRRGGRGRRRSGPTAPASEPSN